MAQVKPYATYPQPFGARNVEAGDYVGPANYQQPGDVLQASQFGWGCFDRAEAGFFSYSGNFFVRVVYPAGRSGPGANVTLQWYNAANSVQVANNSNLSGETAQLMAWGG